MTPTLIPAAVGREWQTENKRASGKKVEHFCQLRALIKANPSAPLMQFYDEAAAYLGCDPDTVRKNLDTIREYDEETMKDWIAAGLGFDHIKWANRLSLVRNAPEPKEILDGAISHGGTDGRRIMTVKEMQAWILGEQPSRPHEYALNVWLAGLHKFIGQLSTKEQAECEKELHAWREKWFS